LARAAPFHCFEQFSYTLFVTLIAGSVVDALAQVIGQALHIGYLAFEVVGVLIA
jgi:hypothetical protein